MGGSVDKFVIKKNRETAAAAMARTSRAEPAADARAAYRGAH